MSKPLPLLARLAVQSKLVTEGQLKQALAAVDAEGLRVGEALLKLGFIDTTQLNALLRRQAALIAKHREKQAAAQGADRTLGSPGAAPAPAGAGATPPPQRPAAGPRPSVAVAAPVAAITPAPAVAPALERAVSQPVEPAIRVSESHAHPLAEPTAADTAKLTNILRQAVAKGASDIHLHSGAPLNFRIRGEMEGQGGGALEAGENERLLASALPAPDRALLAERGELDFCYQLEGIGRFRANFYRQQRGYDAVFRYVCPQPPSLAELGLPQSLEKLTHFHQGMVLVTGPTGCGKSSTLAALVNLINEERGEHILTIEDPIEYVHTSKKCLVNQRSVNRHTESFGRALRAALREDPDVIVIGELRDYETISLALTAAETGHLVLGTLHTNSTIRTVNRLIGVFPSDQQGQVRNMLSESLRAVISQRLIPRANGEGRVPATETLLITRAVGNLIRDNKTFQIHSVLQTGASQGMGLLDDSIRSLVQSGEVVREEALRHCFDPKAIGV